MLLIIPGDITLTGMGNNAYNAARFLIPENQFPDTGEGWGCMLHEIVDPAGVFLFLLLFGKLPAAFTHTGETVVVTVVNVVRKGDGFSRAELGKNFAEIGISQDFFGLNHSIIMVKNQTGVF
jgi:hypothetical protein